jgi:hypothetical protein
VTADSCSKVAVEQADSPPRADPGGAIELAGTVDEKASASMGKPPVKDEWRLPHPAVNTPDALELASANPGRRELTFPPAVAHPSLRAPSSLGPYTHAPARCPRFTLATLLHQSTTRTHRLTAAFTSIQLRDHRMVASVPILQQPLRG